MYRRSAFFGYHAELQSSFENPTNWWMHRNSWWNQRLELKRLNTLGKTRWWAKSNAIREIFGSFDDDDAETKSLFSNVVIALSVIRNNASFNNAIRYKANDLISKILQFDTILTAFLFNKIFSIRFPLYEYLQTHCMDSFQSWRMVDSGTNCLQRLSRDFHTVYDRAIKFCNCVSRIFSVHTNEEQEIIEVSTSFQTIA